MTAAESADAEDNRERGLNKLQIVVIESVFGKEILTGSGVLCPSVDDWPEFGEETDSPKAYDFQWVLTAAHCVTRQRRLRCTFPERMRVRIPKYRQWSPKELKSFRAGPLEAMKSKRFEDIEFTADEIEKYVHVYEPYKACFDSTNGEDFALIRIPVFHSTVPPNTFQVWDSSRDPDGFSISGFPMDADKRYLPYFERRTLSDFGRFEPSSENDGHTQIYYTSVTSGGQAGGPVQFLNAKHNYRAVVGVHVISMSRIHDRASGCLITKKVSEWIRDIQKKQVKIGKTPQNLNDSRQNVNKNLNHDIDLKTRNEPSLNGLEQGFRNADVYITEAGENETRVKAGTCVLMQDPATWGQKDTAPRRWIVTAAHCVSEYSYGKVKKLKKNRILAPRWSSWDGFPTKKKIEHGKSLSEEFYEAIPISRKQIIIHPKYKSYNGISSSGYDIAMIAIPERPVRDRSLNFNMIEPDNKPELICVSGYPVVQRNNQVLSHIPYYSLRVRTEEDDSDDSDKWQITFSKRTVSYPLRPEPGMAGSPLIVEDQIVGIHNSFDEKSDGCAMGTMFNRELKKWMSDTYKTWDSIMNKIVDDQKANLIGEKKIMRMMISPGKLGIEVQSADGCITKIYPGLAQKLGFKLNWKIIRLNGRPYNYERLVRLTKGDQEYEIDFEEYTSVQKQGVQKQREIIEKSEKLRRELEKEISNLESQRDLDLMKKDNTIRDLKQSLGSKINEFEANFKSSQERVGVLEDQLRGLKSEYSTQQVALLAKFRNVEEKNEQISRTNAELTKALVEKQRKMSMEKALVRFLSLPPPPKCVNVLRKVVSNLVQNPDNPKFRSLNVDFIREKFEREDVPWDLGVELFGSLGFTRIPNLGGRIVVQDFDLKTATSMLQLFEDLEQQQKLEKTREDALYAEIRNLEEENEQISKTNAELTKALAEKQKELKDMMKSSKRQINSLKQKISDLEADSLTHERNEKILNLEEEQKKISKAKVEELTNMPPRRVESWELQTRSQSTDCDGLSGGLRACGYTLLSPIYDIEPPQFYSGCVLSEFSNIRALIWSYLDVTFELVFPFTDVLTILRERFRNDISEAIVEFLGIDNEEIFVIHGNSQYSKDSYLRIHPTHRVSLGHVGVYVKQFSKYVLIRSESAICSMYLDEARHSLSTLLCQKGYLMHTDTLMSDTLEDLLEYRAFLEEAKKKKENEEKLPNISRSLKAVKHIQKGQDSSLRCLTASIPLSLISTGRISFEFFNEDEELVVKTAEYVYEDGFMNIVDVMPRRKCLKCDSFIIRKQFVDQGWMSWLWNTSSSAEFGPFFIINTHSEIERDSRSSSPYSIWVDERVELHPELNSKFGKRKLGAVLSVFRGRNIGRAVDEVIRFEKALKKAGYIIFKSKGRKEAPISCCKEDVDQFINKVKSFKWDGVFCMFISHGYNDNKSGLNIPTVVMEGGHDLSIAKFIQLLAGTSFPVIVAANFCRINAVEIDASESQMGLAEVPGEVFVSLGSRSGACATEHEFVSLWRRMLNSDFTEDVIGAVAQEVKRLCGGSYADGLTFDFPCIGGVFCTEDEDY